MTGRPCLQHSNITWYVIQKRKNEVVDPIVEELEDPEVIEEDIKPIAFNTENVQVYVSDAQIKNNLKKTLTSTPANDIIMETPEKKEKVK